MNFQINRRPLAPDWAKILRIFGYFDSQTDSAYFAGESDLVSFYDEAAAFYFELLFPKTNKL